MSSDKIARALGLTPIEELKEEDFYAITPSDDDIISMPELPADANQEEVIIDATEAKNNIANLIRKGNISLDDLLNIAKQSENIKAFETASTLIKILVEANKDLVAMSERKKYAKDEKNSSPTTNITNNNLIMSTSDILKMMKGES